MKRLFISLLLLTLAAPLWAAEPLKLGVLLIEDAVPLYLAENEGYYTDENLDVELVPFLSALERDAALTAGAIDGAITDPVGALLFDKGRGEIKITSLCLGKTPAEGVFAILSAPGSSITTPESLKNVEIAVSSATIIEYVTDRLLADQGLRPEEIQKIEVKKMPIRMQMLLSGSVQAATLPEPLASIAAGKGAKIVITDASSNESLSQTVIVFKSTVLKDRKSEVSRFFKAYRRSVEAINSDPEKYRNLFVEKGRIPPFLAEQYAIPNYPLPAPYSRTLYTPVIQWLTEKNLVNSVPYESMVADDFMAAAN
jgi:NitT/TauT family transport system substrate-binding protein